jgi:hypothetical protein
LEESLGLGTSSAIGAFTLTRRVGEVVLPAFFMEDVIAVYTCTPLSSLDVMCA